MVDSAAVKRNTSQITPGSTAGTAHAGQVVVSVPAIRTEAGVVTMSLSREVHSRIGRAERAFPADGGYPVVSGTMPTLRLVQLDPFNSTKALRIVILRWERGSFRQQMEALAPFRKKLREHIEAEGDEDVWTPDAVRAASPDVSSGSTVAVLDVDSMVIVRGGSRTQAVFLSFSPGEYNAAAAGLRSSVSLKAELDVSMPTLAMLNLLNEWTQASGLEV